MAAEDITFQADQGTPEQLPQGAATQLNDALPTETASPPETAAGPEAAAPQPATPADYEPKFTPATDDESFLVGPTTRPAEPLTAGAQVRDPKALPPDFGQWFPV